MRARLMVSLSLSSLAALGCHTRRPVLPPQPFLERMYVSRTPQDTSIMFEAQVATHVLLLDGLPDAYDALSSDIKTSHARAWRLILTPMFRIRQLNDSSAAVRTPSFMPRLSLERLWVSRLGKATGMPNVPLFPMVQLVGGRVTLAHHSNGQAGCFREGFVPVNKHSDECRPRPGFDTTVFRLNRADGDFSSTFVNVMLHYTLMNRDDAGWATKTVGAAASVDWHAHGLFGELSDEQRQLYGGWRVRGQIEGMLTSGVACTDKKTRTSLEKVGCGLRGRTRLTLEGERAPKAKGPLASRISPAILPYRESIELSHAFDALLGAGAFIRWHDGQDYYNIGFVNRRTTFMYGLTLDLGGAHRIAKRVIM
jgi:hypothetical protein